MKYIGICHLRLVNFYFLCWIINRFCFYSKIIYFVIVCRITIWPTSVALFISRQLLKIVIRCIFVGGIKLPVLNDSCRVRIYRQYILSIKSPLILVSVVITKNLITFIIKHISETSCWSLQITAAIIIFKLISFGKERIINIRFTFNKLISFSSR